MYLIPRGQKKCDEWAVDEDQKIIRKITYSLSRRSRPQDQHMRLAPLSTVLLVLLMILIYLLIFLFNLPDIGNGSAL
ncbi:hypothetical protein ACS0TY_011586 [Phlomoides rotata]